MHQVGISFGGILVPPFLLVPAVLLSVPALGTTQLYLTWADDQHLVHTKVLSAEWPGDIPQLPGQLQVTAKLYTLCALPYLWQRKWPKQSRQASFDAMWGSGVAGACAYSRAH